MRFVQESCVQVVCAYGFVQVVFVQVMCMGFVQVFFSAGGFCAGVFFFLGGLCRGSSAGGFVHVFFSQVVLCRWFLCG